MSYIFLLLNIAISGMFMFSLFLVFALDLRCSSTNM